MIATQVRSFWAASKQCSEVHAALVAHTMRAGIADPSRHCRFEMMESGGTSRTLTCSPTHAGMVIAGAPHGGCVDRLFRRKKKPPLRVRITDVDDSGALLFEEEPVLEQRSRAGRGRGCARPALG